MKFKLICLLLLTLQSTTALANLQLSLFVPRESQFWQRLGNFASAAAQDLDADLTIYSADNSPQKMLDQVKAAVEGGADGILFVNYAGIGEEILKITEQNHTPALLINTALDNPLLLPRVHYSSWIGSIIPDDRLAGVRLATGLFEQARRKGISQFNILAYTGRPESRSQTRRFAGLKSVIDALPEAHLVANLANLKTPEQAARQFRQTFARHPEINVVWSYSDSYAVAAARSQTSAVRKKRVFGGIDWSPDALQSLREGLIDVDLGGHIFDGAQGVIMLYDYLHEHDFNTEKLTWNSAMVAANAQNIEHIQNILRDPKFIDYRFLSKTYNPRRLQYNFRLDTLQTRSSFISHLTDEESRWLKAHPQLLVGVMDSWPPVSQVDASGQPRGIDIDILQALNKRLGYRLKAKPGPWNEIYNAVKEKRLDLIMGITPREFRKPFFNFSRPYLSVPHVIVARKNNKPFYENENDLRGKTLALERDFVNVEYFRKHYPDVNIKTYDNTLAALEAVSRGDADAYAGSRLVVLYLIEKELLSNLKIQGRLSKPATALAIGARKDYVLLARIVQKALNDIPPQVIKKIIGDWVYTPETSGDRLLILSTQEQHWLAQHKSIRVGVDGNWAPIDFYDEQGKLQGITADYLSLLSAQTGIRFETDNAGGWSNMLNEARAHEFDMVASLAENPAREKFWTFSPPYFESPYVITARKQSTDLNSLQALQDKTVAIEKGYYLQRLLQQKFPRIHLLEVENTLQALKAVSRERADAYIGNQVVIFYLIEHQRLTNLKVVADTGFKPNQLHFGIRKDWPELSSIINKAFASISSEQRLQIDKKWLGYSTPTQHRSFQLSPQQSAWLKRHPQLTVGAMSGWPPFDFINQNGEPDGIGKDLVDELNQRLDNRIRIQSGNWKQIYDDVVNKKLDFILDITPKPSRLANFNFTSLYLEVPHVIIARKQASFIANAAALKGKTLALEEGFGNVNYFRQNYPAVSIRLYPDTRKALEAVSRGDADAYAGNRVVAMYLIDQYALNNLKVHGTLKKGGSRLAIGTRKDYPILRDILQLALDDIGDKKIRSIRNRWLGISDTRLTSVEKIELSNEEKNWIQQHPLIRLGVDPGWAPIEYIDEDGHYQGLSSAYIEYIGQLTGLKFAPPQRIKWSNMLKKLQRREIDLAPTISITSRRKKYLNFTQPYINLPIVVFNRRGDNLLSGLPDLAGKKIGTIKGYSVNEYLARDYPEIQQVYFNNINEGLDGLSTGKVDAYIDVLAVGGSQIASKGYTNLQVASTTPYNFDFSMGVRKDWPILLGILNKAINSISEQKKNEFQRRWLTVHFKPEIDYSIGIWVFVIALIIVILFMLRAREMARINHKLQLANQAVERSSRFKSQFLANMSHEIRTPMNAIVGLGHLLSRTRLDDKQQNYILNLQKAAQTLLGLIDDILDLSKIEAGHIKIDPIDFNLDELLQDLAQLVHHKIEDKQLEFIYNLDPAIPLQLNGDAYRLNQILINLVSNAVKFTDAGHIMIKVEMLRDKSSDDEHQIWLKFSVSDSGKGIAPDKLKHLFDPFEQEDNSTTRKYGGTGLGLSISRQLVELMGGDIHVDSHPGAGSNFYFNLPFKQNPHSVQAIKTPVPDLRGLRILLVDDNPHALENLKSMLQSMTFDVTTAASGSAAMRQLERARQPFDLILLDWRMPEMDGEQTVRLIHQQLPAQNRPSIIMMTAYGRDALEHNIDKSLLDGFLIKPITPSQLFDAIMHSRKQALPVAETAPPSDNDNAQLDGLVLLAEDNKINQQVAYELLVQMGLEVWICETGVEVLEALDKHIPDLVLMDIQMPQMDGYQAAREIRKTLSPQQLPIIAMTANAMLEDVEKSITAGMQAHISKPVDPQKLFQILSQYLQKSSRNKQTVDPSDNHFANWPDHVPGLDIRQGVKQVGGNEQLYQKLLKEFLINHRHSAQSLQQALQNHELDKAARIAHTLKGVSANIGASELHRVAERINTLLEENQAIDTHTLHEFDHACNELCASLQTLVDNELTRRANSDATDEDAEALLESLKQALRNSDAQSHPLFEQWSQTHPADIDDDQLQQISQLINDYEYESALALLLRITEPAS